MPSIGAPFERQDIKCRLAVAGTQCMHGHARVNNSTCSLAATLLFDSLQGYMMTTHEGQAHGSSKPDEGSTDTKSDEPGSPTAAAARPGKPKPRVRFCQELEPYPALLPHTTADPLIL